MWTVLDLKVLQILLGMTKRLCLSINTTAFPLMSVHLQGMTFIPTDKFIRKFWRGSFVVGMLFDQPALVRKITILVNFKSSLWRPILTFPVRWHPLVAIVIIIAEKEEVSQSSIKDKKVQIGTFNPGNCCMCPVWNKKSVVRHFNFLR